MEIKKEFEIFSEKALTDKGWQEVENAWHFALNYELREGHWYKKRASDGDSVAGFAIDPKTLLYKIGPIGRDHFSAKLDLSEEVCDKAPGAGLEETESRIVDGRLAIVPNYSRPLIMVVGMWLFEPGAKEMLDRLEGHILNEGLGFPIRGIHFKKDPALFRAS